MHRCFWVCCLLLCVLYCAPSGWAAEAENLSGKKLITRHSGFDSVTRLFDGRTTEYVKVRKGGKLTLKAEQGIGSLYLVFGTEPGSYTVTEEAQGESRCFGESGFLHEFLNLEEAFGYAPEQVTLSFDKKGVSLGELSAFTTGEVPDWVQQWQVPKEREVDLVLFSAHGDDEQLFFAGLLPYYAAERGCNVQVVYLTGHRNMTVRRSHEMLDGLWAVGVKNYPVFGPFGDYYTRSLEEAYLRYRYKGTEKEELLSFVVENIRRFQPKVAVGHDLNGEYGHGMHMVYADLLCQAVEISADPDRFPNSEERYGCWDVPKTYLHLYPENEIWMDWDVPLESFGGMTAFEVTQKLGFPRHISQQADFGWFFQGIHSAAQIPQYSPCAYGLYRSMVGADVRKQDLFENVTTYAEDALAEAQLQEELARLEAERIRMEEEAAQAEMDTQILPTTAQNAVVAASAEDTFMGNTVIVGIMTFFKDISRFFMEEMR